MKKRSFTSICLMLMSYFSLVAWNGNGTVNSPYLIQTREDLAQLAEEVQDGDDYNGTYFAMINDIDLENQEWTPIGSTIANFCGKFDGCGYTVRNLMINQESGNQVQGVGLFGHVRAGEVKNLGLVNAKVTIGNASYAAAFIGCLQGGNLSNCYVENVAVEIIAGFSGQHAIFIGRNYNSSISDCYVANSSLKPIAQVAGLFVGSINLNGKITNCYALNCEFIGRNAPAMSGEQALQGVFCGEANPIHTTTFNNCYATPIENFTFSGKKGTDTQFLENSTIVSEESLLKTEEEFAHPYLAWKLNRSGGDGEHSGRWSHNGEHPIFTNEENIAVYQTGIIYDSNLSSEEIYSVSGVSEDFAAIDLREHYDAPSYSLLENILSKGSINKLIYLPADATDVPANWNNVIKGAKGEGRGELRLVDEIPFRCPESFYAESASYERECHTDGGWETIMLPFPVAEIQTSVNSFDITGRFNMEKYSEQNESESSVIKFSLIDLSKGEFSANTPYLMKYNGDEGSVSGYMLPCTFTGRGQIVTTNQLSSADSFKGTYEILKGENLWMLSEDGTYFGRGSNESSLYPFRAYLDLSQSDDAAPQYSIMHDDSGTTSMKESVSDVSIYVTNGVVFINSDVEKDITIYTLGGYQVRKILLKQGLNSIPDLPSGLYLIDKQKVAIL